MRTALAIALLPLTSFAALADPTGSNTYPSTLVLPATTVAKLPSCNTGLQGVRATVTDQATAISYLGATSGSGTTVMGVLCNGSNWIQD
jgi:hypothetical protein